MKRVVLDTNIVVSSALGGALEEILKKWADDAFVVIVTIDIIDEYFQVINRPKFRLDQSIIDRIVRYLYQFSEFVVPEEKIQIVRADPNDDKFIEAAVAGRAEYIVSGDNHLLELGSYRGISIITGREFLNVLTATRPSVSPP